MNRFFIAVSLLFINMGSVEASTLSPDEQISCNVEISLNQIHVTEDGIFVYIHHHFFPAKSIYLGVCGQYYCDIYNIAEDYVTCAICGDVYHKYFDGKCTNRICPSRW